MISYRNLKILLAKREMTGADFRKAVGISQATYTKINQNQYIALSVIDRICSVLCCDISDVVEYVKNTEEEESENNMV